MQKVQRKKRPGGSQNPRVRLRRVLQAMAKLYGAPVWGGSDSEGGADVLSALIMTMLSQATTDTNRDLAYRRLRERFSTWEEVLRADVAAVEEAIRPGGLSRQKSVRIQGLLAWLKETRGELTADFLCDLSLEEAIEELGHLRGIGIKTLSVVLMFTCGRDVFPVDTHVHRVSRRLGFISEKCSAEKAHGEMSGILRPGESYPAHINFWKFGKFICKSRRPRCGECPLVRDCVYPDKNL